MTPRCEKASSLRNRLGSTLFSLIVKYFLLQLEDFVVSRELLLKFSKKRFALVIATICQHAAGICQTLRSLLVGLIFLGRLQQPGNLILIQKVLAQFDQKLD